MLKRVLLVLGFLLLAGASRTWAQTAALQNHCFLGGTAAKTSGLASSNYLNGIIPHCTVTVYLTGTQTLATIYSSATNAPLSNPFTANTLTSVNPGGWIFWAAVNQGYDIVMSGGDPPNIYPQPVPLIDQFPGFQFSGGGSGTVQATPQFRIFIQPNAGTVAVAGAASTSQNAVTPILQGVANTDIFGSVSSTLTSPFCNASGCFFARPQTSADTTNVLTALNSAAPFTHGEDSEYGIQGDYFWNAGHVTSGNDFTTARPLQCFWNTPYSNFIGHRFCRESISIYAVPGNYITNDWSLAEHAIDYFYAFERSISQRNGGEDFMYHVGDQADLIHYLHYRGGAIAASDEGVETQARHALEAPAPYGTVTTGGTNATIVKSNFTTNAGNQGDGMDLVDTSQVMATGYLGAQTITGGNAANTFVSVDINGAPTTHTVSSGMATLTADCGANTIRNTPASATCNVTVNSGTFTAGGTNTVCVADWHYPEQAAITATGAGTLSLTLAYSHPSGTQIFQGGGCGGKLALGNGVTDPSTLHQFTTYFIAGAPTMTTYAYVAVFEGGSNGAQQIALIPQAASPSIQFSFVQRSANVVSASFVSSGEPLIFMNYTPPAGATLQATGFTPSDFNGTITTPLAWNPTTSTMTWSQTGANETASVNGTLTWVGLNNYVMYCGAETTAVLGVTQNADGTPNLDGTLQLEANNCNWTAGDNVVQPNHYATHVQAVVDENRGMTPPPSALENDAHLMYFNGAAWSGADVFNIQTSDALSSFLGYGGTETGRTFLKSIDYYANVFNLAHSPLNGTGSKAGNLFQIGCPAEGCSATNFDYDLFNLTGVGGITEMMYRPSVNRLAFTTPTEFRAPVSVQGALGIGIYLGNNYTPPGTAAQGGYFSPAGNYGDPNFFDTLNLGTGALGDATGTLGASVVTAPTVRAGVADIPLSSLNVTPNATGATTYTYVCTMTTALGESAGTARTITNGAATPNNKISCPPMPGATGIKVYRTVGGATTGLIDTRTATQFYTLPLLVDNNLTATAGSPPAANTTGQLAINGTNYTVQGATGAKLLACIGTFTVGHIVTVDANGNCVDGGAAPVNIANVQIVLPVTALAANTCSAVITTTMTGVTTTSTFTSAFASDPSAVTGYGSSGGLSIAMWPTANANNLKLCNPTASSITPGAMTINVGAK